MNINKKSLSVKIVLMSLALGGVLTQSVWAKKVDVKPDSKNNNTVEVLSTEYSINGNTKELGNGNTYKYIYGGYSLGSSVGNNSVTFYGGSFSYDVHGGYSAGGTANENVLTINGGNFTADVYGGCSTVNNVSDNQVNIIGGTFSGTIYGGRSTFKTGSATNNIVTISGGNLSSANVYGGSAKTSSGNTLSITGKGITVKSVNNFQNYNFTIPSGFNKSSDMMLTISGDLAFTSSDAIKVDVANVAGSLNPNDVITLVKANSISGFANITAANKTVSNGEYAYNATISVANSKLILTVDVLSVIPTAKFTGNIVEVTSPKKASINSTSIECTKDTWLYAYGGYSNNSDDVKNNTITFSGTAQVTESLYGGYSKSGTVQGNTANLQAGTVGGTIYGGYSDSGVVTGNIANITGGAVTSKIVYGGYSKSNTAGGTFAAAGNKVTLNGSSVTLTSIYGGFSESGAASFNVAEVKDGSVTTVYGGYTSGSGTVASNSASISGGSVSGNVYGGYSSSAVKSNSVTITAGTFAPSSIIYGGYSDSGTAGGDSTGDGNSVTLGGTSNVKAVYGGYGKNANRNKVTVNEGYTRTITGSDKTSVTIVFKDYEIPSFSVAGGRGINTSLTADGSADYNEVLIKGGTFSQSVVGGLISAGSVEYNKVNISGGTFARAIYGGYTIAGSAKNNNITISGGTFSGAIYGGYSETVGNATDNMVTISGGALSSADIYGGKALVGTSTGNTLSITAKGISVNSVNNFQSYNFTIPDGFNKSFDVMLTINNEFTLGWNDSISVSGSNINIGDSITLVTTTSGVDIGSFTGKAATGTGSQGVLVVENSSKNLVLRLVGTNDLKDVLPTSSKTGNNVTVISDWKATFDGKDQYCTEAVWRNAYGGYSDGSDTVSGNTITFSDMAQVTGSLYGGYGKEARENKVIVSTGYTGTVGGTTLGFSLVGGRATNGSANYNEVQINGGTYRNDVAGGYTPLGGNASNNRVTINAGTFNGDVYGGWSLAGGDAKDNIVTISGGDLSKADVYGGVATVGSTSSGNTLNITGKNISVKSVQDFQNYNFTIPSEFDKSKDVMLTISGNTALKFASTDKITVDVALVASALSTKDTITLISSNKAMEGFDNIAKTSRIVKNGENAYIATITMKDSNNKQLILTAGVEYLVSVIPAISTTGNTVTVTSPIAAFFDGENQVCTDPVWHNAYGGYSDESANVTSNTITFSGTAQVTESLYGGYSASGKVQGNIVNLEAGIVGGKVYGGYSGTNAVTSNSVNISGGSVGDNVYGGYSESGAVTGNALNVSVGDFTSVVLYGGYSNSGNVGSEGNGNIVTISGSVKVKEVYGGYGTKEVAYNKVQFSDDYSGTVGTIISNGQIYGGYATGANANANNNEVSIADGTYRADIYGGYAGGAANGNKVTVSGGEYHKDIYGGYADGAASSNIVNVSSGDFNHITRVASISIYGGYSSTDASNNKVQFNNTYTGNFGKELLNDSVYGGYATGANANANNNEVSIADGIYRADIYGGYAGGAANGNKVTVSDGDYHKDIYGGYGGSSAAGNTVAISGGELSSLSVYGGYSKDGTVGGSNDNGNSVTISAGSVAGGVYGGFASGSGAVSYNNVTVSGNGSVSNSILEGLLNGVYGGYSTTGEVSNNGVNISGGSVSSDVYGGYAVAGNATGNNVTVSSGTVTGNIYGGYALAGSATGNSVIVSGGDLSKADVYGGVGSTSSGNTLSITEKEITIKSVNNFQNYNFTLSEGYKSTDVMLTIAGGLTGWVLKGDDTVKVTGLASGLTIGDMVTLVKSSSHDMDISDFNKKVISDSDLRGVLMLQDNDRTLVVRMVGKDELLDVCPTAISGNTVEVVSEWKAQVTNGSVKYEQYCTESVWRDAYGGYSSGAYTVSNNTITFSDTAKVTGSVYGGYSGSGAVIGNTANITGGKVSGNVYGGYSESGAVTGNALNVSAGDFTSVVLYGGYSNSGNVGSEGNGNIVTISGSAKVKEVYGGYGTKEVAYNKVQFSDGYSGTVGTIISKGQIYGGYATGANANANNNEVSIADGIYRADIYGGYAGGAANGNKVTVSDGEYHKDIYGGYGGSSAAGNTVTISGGELFSLSVYGGYSKDGTVGSKDKGNSVTISAGSVAGGVYGGFASGSGAVSYNNVTVSDNGSVSNSILVGLLNGVYGGYSTTGAVSNNGVNVSGGNVESNIYGGYAAANNALGNSVSVSSGTVTKAIYGGYSNSGSAGENIVEISGNTTSVRFVYGGYGKSATGNKVEVKDTFEGEMTGSGGTDVLPSFSVVGGRAVGVTQDSDANENTVEIGGGIYDGIVVGGYVSGTDGNADSNIVTIGNGTFRDTIYGGFSVAHNVRLNSVAINSGTFTKAIYGGYAAFGTAGGREKNDEDAYSLLGNSVTIGNISGDVKVTSDIEVIYGGCGDAAIGNSVRINDTYTGTVKGVDGVSVVGGRATGVISEDSDANWNAVSINGGAYSGIVAGGYVSGAEGNADNNTVIISNGTFSNSVYGGYSASHNVRDNTVTISGGQNKQNFNISIYAGYSDKGEVQGNSVTISAGTYSATVYGGKSASTNKVVSGNVVTLQGCGVVNGNIIGGQAKGGNATGNIVNIDSGTVNGNVYGGYTASGDATANIVNVSGGLVDGNINVGKSDNGTVSGNTLNWSGGTINGSEIVGNTVNITGTTATYKGTDGTIKADSAVTLGDGNDVTFTVGDGETAFALTFVSGLDAKANSNLTIRDKSAVTLQETSNVAGTISGAGTLINGGTLTIAAGNLGVVTTNNDTLNLGVGTLTKAITGGTLNINDNVTTVANNIAGDTNVVAGTKTLTLTEGTLSKDVINNGTIKITGDVTISSKLNGGTVGKLVVESGTLQYTNTNASSITNNVEIKAGATFDPYVNVFAKGVNIKIEGEGTLVLKPGILYANIEQKEGSLLTVDANDLTKGTTLLTGVDKASQLDVKNGTLKIKNIKAWDCYSLISGVAVTDGTLKLDDLWYVDDKNLGNLLSEYDIKDGVVTLEFRNIPLAVEANTSALAGVQQGAITMVNQITDAIGENVGILARPAQDGVYDKTIWANYINSKETVNGMSIWRGEGNNTAKYHGVTVGADFYTTKKAIAGVALTYVTGDVMANPSDTVINNKTKYYGISFYDRITNGKSALTYDLGYSVGKNEITQNSYQTVTADAKTNAYTLGAKYEYAYNFKHSSLVPFASLRYLRLTSNDYTNSNGHNMSIDRQNLIVPKVGLAWTGSFEMPKCAWTFKPVAEVGYIWNLKGREADGTFTSRNSTYSVAYDTVDKSSYYTKLGLNFNKRNFTGGVSYRYAKGDAARQNSWNVNLNWSF